MDEGTSTAIELLKRLQKAKEDFKSLSETVAKLDKARLKQLILKEKIISTYVEEVKELREELWAAQNTIRSLKEPKKLLPPLARS